MKLKVDNWLWCIFCLLGIIFMATRLFPDKQVEELTQKYDDCKILNDKYYDIFVEQFGE